MAQLIQAGEFVGPGEALAAVYLEKELPSSWVVIANKELVGRTGTSEVDFIIVADHCVFVVEEKSWSGPIHGNDNGWVLSSGESFGSPLSKIGFVARRLAGMLRDSVPMLRDQLGERQHFVFPRVLLSSARVQLYVHDPRAPEQVLRLQGCEQDFMRWDKLQGSIASLSAFKKGVVARLTALQNRPKMPREVGAYRVAEMLPTSGPVRALRARHLDGSERLLKLVPQPGTLDPSRRADEERAGLREYDALRKLASLGVAPTVEAYFPWDQDAFWVVPVMPPGGPSLRADRTGAAPAEARVRRVCEAAFRALTAVHAAGVVHRAINPDRVVLRADDSILFTDLVIARVEGQTTIGPIARELDPPDSYAAPECRVSPELAEPASDVYSLAAALVYWITGQEPEPDRLATSRIAEQRPDLPNELRSTLDTVFAQALAEDERVRPSPVDIVSELAPSVAPPTELPGRERPAAPITVGSLLDGRYRILRLLGEGGTAYTYLAHDTASELDVVLKRIKNPELISRLAKAEFRMLVELHHSALPRVFDVGLPGDAFHLKLEYIPGATIKELAPKYRGDVEFCVTVARQILDALEYVQGRGPMHRDISPSNIMVVEADSGVRATLIDFGLATSDTDSVSAVGTPRYRAPEMDRERSQWRPRCDLYSLGAVLHELLTGRLPYALADGRPRKMELVAHTPDEVERYGRRLLDVLLRACAPDPDERYQTADEFARALAGTEEASPPEVEGEERVNPTVESLRGVYRNSRVGNPDNRGMDTPFAWSTYVPTRLDTELLPQVLAGEHRLVILSGNPGDGKTAFLARLHSTLLEGGAQEDVGSDAGWRIRHGTQTVAALYDASESHAGKSADDLLHDVLRPLAGNHTPDSRYTAAIAANDGRLIDFFERFGDGQYGWLWPRLRPQLTSGAAARDGVLLVDLKRRALVEDLPNRRGMFESILAQFVSPERWTVCEGCTARLECPMRTNALSFSDPALSAITRDRLRDLLLAVHLRRERRATLRDLRSALAFTVTHDLSCEEVHEERRRGVAPLAEPARLYFNAAFDGAGSPDLLLDEWQQLDPASTPNASLDRFLYLHRRRSEAATLRGMFAAPGRRPPLPVLADVGRLDQWMASLKRRYFFEGQAGISPEGQRQGTAAGASRRLPPAAALFPYRYFDAFRDALRGVGDDGQVLLALVEGISVADGVPAEAARSVLAVRMTERDGAVVVIKRFPVAEFELRRPQSSTRFVEGGADQLVLRHRDGVPELTISLDLFELLLRSADGSLPGSLEQSAMLEDLTIFKNQLLARPASDVIIVEGGSRFHTVRAVGGTIVRVQETA